MMPIPSTQYIIATMVLGVAVLRADDKSAEIDWNNKNTLNTSLNASADDSSIIMDWTHMAKNVAGYRFGFAMSLGIPVSSKGNGSYLSQIDNATDQASLGASFLLSSGEAIGQDIQTIAAVWSIRAGASLSHGRYTWKPGGGPEEESQSRLGYTYFFNWHTYRGQAYSRSGLGSYRIRWSDVDLSYNRKWKAADQVAVVDPAATTAPLIIVDGPLARPVLKLRGSWNRVSSSSMGWGLAGGYTWSGKPGSMALSTSESARAEVWAWILPMTDSPNLLIGVAPFWEYITKGDKDQRNQWGLVFQTRYGFKFF